MKKILLVSILVSAGIASASALVAKPLQLAKNGSTDYVITSGTSVEDKFAVGELKKTLKASTGADFKSVTIEQAAQHHRRIIVGNNALSEKLLGTEAVNSFQPDESLVMVKGDDLILTGEGERGPSYAVYSFLENELGCRWYTAYKDIVIPSHKTLTLDPLERRETPAFRYRYLSQYFYQLRPDREFFFFRNRLNNIANATVPGIKGVLPDIGPGVHTLFFYINPDDTNNPVYAKYPNPPKNNFFQTNPEFFSMNKQGERVKTLQLCFSNLELRQTFTEHLEDIIKATGLTSGVVSVDANDVPGKFCHCPECEKLEEKYHTVSGPLLDYLIELCDTLKEKHPGIFVKTLAYRKKQTEIPPENIARLPENLIIVFAPIDDNFARTMDDPSNEGTLENLKRWTQLATNVWVWYYTNPYLSPNPPMGNIRKLAHDIKIIRDAGVTGTFFEHTTGVATGYNFSELQTWLMLKLFQNPDQNVDALVTEFTDYYYGPAAPLMRSYIDELEKLRKELPIPMPWNPSFSHFPFHTPERIVTWEKAFDTMEALTKDNSENLLHVRTARIPLDITMLRKWHAIRKQYPNINATPQKLHSRILANFDAMAMDRFPTEAGRNAHRKFLQRDLPAILLLAEAEPKPLPEFFNQFPADNIRRAFPTKKTFKDPEAALGVAIGGAWEKRPVDFGFYDNASEKWILSSKIPEKSITPDRYEFYKLGTTELTAHCLVWVTDGWIITLPVDQFCVIGYPFLKWNIYVSLKFEGPKYGSSDPETPNRISCDQVVLVRKDSDPADNGTAKNENQHQKLHD